MNIAGSLVESYMYADMYNREYEGGSDIQERIQVGGFPVENVLSSTADIKKYETAEQDGGKSPKNKTGPLSNKVVPVGLVLIQTKRVPDVEYTDHYFPGVNREVVPEHLYDTLIGSILLENRTSPSKRTSFRFRSNPNSKTQKERSRKNHRK